MAALCAERELGEPAEVVPPMDEFEQVETSPFGEPHLDPVEAEVVELEPQRRPWDVLAQAEKLSVGTYSDLKATLKQRGPTPSPCPLGDSAEYSPSSCCVSP